MLLDRIDRLAIDILHANGFDEAGGRSSDEDPVGNERPEVFEDDAILESAGKFSDFRNAWKVLENPVPFESPEETVNICIDDANAKKQEDKRPERTGPKETRRTNRRNRIQTCGLANNSIVTAQFEFFRKKSR